VEGLEGQLLVLSPHFDDAVMSCGELIGCRARTVVVTVCSGLPGPGVPASPGWDAPTTGFALADEAARCRTEEDRSALRILGATQRGLGQVDELYRRPEDRNEARRAGKAALEALLDKLRPRTLIFPIGLGAQGSDHDLAQEIAVAALKSRRWCHAVAYAELPYLFSNAWRLPIRLASLGTTEPITGPTLSGSTKANAVRCYATQLPWIAGWEAVTTPGVERYYRIAAG
jgi:LmbE family N-acetylglucosaminyl deacetylase